MGVVMMGMVVVARGVVVVAVVMMMPPVSGRRTHKHQHKQHGGKNLLHGKNVSRGRRLR
jgi:hypothetical protein